MKHPYICLVSGDEVTALITHHNFGIIIDDPKKVLEETSKKEYRNTYTENNDGSLRSHVKNITTEYLANTYGEVKSKEHAEFIEMLCEVNKINVSDVYRESHKFFSVIGNGLLFFSHDTIPSKDGRKLITIPLPPECESVDEWPVVGSIVEWGRTGKGEVKSLSDGSAWIKLDNKDYTTVYVSSLRKPKTPEQELRDEVVKQLEVIIGHNLDNYKTIVNSIADSIVNNKISGFDITKKPQ